eukprot:PhF_6_TR2221/c2_g1_i2/m.3711
MMYLNNNSTTTSRAAFADCTKRDAQAFNTPRTSSMMKTMDCVAHPTLAYQQAPAQTYTHIRTYSHNPYLPVQLTEVEDTTAEIQQQQQYVNAACDQSMYVNGRRILVSGVTTTHVVASVPNTSVMNAAGMTTNQPCDLSLHDISMETDSSADVAHHTPSSVYTETNEQQGRECLYEEDLMMDAVATQAEEEVESVTVQFHAHQGKYLNNICCDIGDFIAVEGDRGFDIGYIVEKGPRHDVTADPKKAANTTPQWVMRHASPQEIRTAQTELIEMEDIALKRIRAEVERLNLRMTVHACDYQFDRKKLSFYFEAQSKVMFVSLLKSLHREFQCRIWLQQLNRNNKSSSSTGNNNTNNANDEWQ